MADKNEQRPSLMELMMQMRASNRRRTAAPPRRTPEERPDVVASTMQPRMREIDHQAQQAQQQRENAERKKQQRNEYRQRKHREQPTAGYLAMSDADIDRAMQNERLAAESTARQGEFRQASSTKMQAPNTDRLADQYAAVSNFYTSLGSPSVMPMTDAQVRANPQAAQAGLHYGLTNPGMRLMQTSAATVLGNGILNSPAVETAVNTTGRAFIPSQWTQGLSTYFPRYASQLQTAGLWGDALAASALAGPGVYNMAEGAYNGNWGQVANGATDVVFSLPFVQEMRPLRGVRTAAPVARAASAPATRTAQAVDKAVFSPTARATTTAGAVTMPLVAAAADDSVQESGGFWNHVADHPIEYGFGTYLAGKHLIYRPIRGIRNRYFNEPTEGRPADFTEKAPVRETNNMREPVAPVAVEAPNYADFEIAPPEMPRPTFFSEPEPALPTGNRPKGKGKKARRWDEQNQAHAEWEQRRDQHQREAAVADQAWNEYDATGGYDQEGYRRAVDEYNTSMDQYDRAKAQYDSDLAAWQAEEQRLDAAHQQATEAYNQRKQEYDTARATYEASDAYKNWLARRQNIESKWKKAGRWTLTNIPEIGFGSYLLYNMFSGDSGDGTQQPAETQSSAEQKNDSTGVELPEGFVRPIEGVNPETGAIVVPSASGRPDSIINIEPMTQTRFGRGGS